jgi:hypothetical protein
MQNGFTKKLLTVVILLPGLAISSIGTSGLFATQAIVAQAADGQSCSAITLVSGTNTETAGYTEASTTEASALLPGSYTPGVFASATITQTVIPPWIDPAVDPNFSTSSAVWISTNATWPGGTGNTEGAPGNDQWRLFRDSFTLPAGASVTSAEVVFTADNAAGVYLNGSSIATTNGSSSEDVFGPVPGALPQNFGQVFSTSFTPAPGSNTLDFAVRNWGGDFNPNPTGLLYKATINYCVPIVPPQDNVTVTIAKYLDGTLATPESASSTAFPMHAIFPGGEGDYALSSIGFNNDTPYKATTSEMPSGSIYSTYEITGGDVVGTDCEAGQPYSLLGYSTGGTLAEAASSTPTSTVPSFTNLTTDQYVIVWNKTCVPEGHIIVNKVTDPAGDPQSFDFVTTGTGYNAFSLTDTSTPNDQALAPGTYTVSESSTAGWSLTNVSCLYDNEAIGTPVPNGKQITIAAGETAICTFTNTKDPVATSTLKVHILKYLDGVKANASSANNFQFPMTATWQTANLDGGATSTGTYVLGNNHGGAPDLYGADTALMEAPANYTTAELTNDIASSSPVLPVGAACLVGDYRLEGYQTSAVSFADAATQSSTVNAPDFTGLTTDQYVIVSNITCPTKGTLVVTKNTIGGDGTFMFTGDNGLGNFSITTASSTGSSTFTNLTPGIYHVTEFNTPHSKWIQVDTDCSAVTVTAGGVSACTVTNSKNLRLGEIRGTKYEDKNGDGKLKDNNRRRLSGWTIYIDKNNNSVLDPNESSTVTDNHGRYRFSNLPVGTYIIREVGQAGWIQTYPLGGSYTVVLSSGKIMKKKDFGNFHLGTISGMKFNDENGNHRKDSGEVGLSGWTITLAKLNSSFATTTLTDANGNYSFMDLGPGTYQVREVPQSGWIQTTNNPRNIRVRSGTVSRNDNFGNHFGPIDRDHDDEDNHWDRDRN